MQLHISACLTWDVLLTNHSIAQVAIASQMPLPVLGQANAHTTSHLDVRTLNVLLRFLIAQDLIILTMHYKLTELSTHMKKIILTLHSQEMVRLLVKWKSFQMLFYLRIIQILTPRLTFFKDFRFIQSLIVYWTLYRTKSHLQELITCQGFTLSLTLASIGATHYWLQ